MKTRIARLLVLSALSLPSCNVANDPSTPLFRRLEVTGIVTEAATGAAVGGATVSVDVIPPTITGSRVPAQQAIVTTDPRGVYMWNTLIPSIGNHVFVVDVVPADPASLSPARVEQMVVIKVGTPGDTARVTVDVKLTAF